MIASQMWRPGHPTRGRLGAELSQLRAGVAFDEQRYVIADGAPLEQRVFLMHDPVDVSRPDVRMLTGQPLH
jgi:hypothetical protein